MKKWLKCFAIVVVAPLALYVFHIGWPTVFVYYLVVAFFASLFFEFAGVREFVGLDFADHTFCGMEVLPDLWSRALCGEVISLLFLRLSHGGIYASYDKEEWSDSGMTGKGQSLV